MGSATCSMTLTRMEVATLSGWSGLHWKSTWRISTLVSMRIGTRSSPRPSPRPESQISPLLAQGSQPRPSELRPQPDAVLNSLPRIACIEMLRQLDQLQAQRLQPRRSEFRTRSHALPPSLPEMQHAQVVLRQLAQSILSVFSFCCVASFGRGQQLFSILALNRRQ